MSCASHCMMIHCDACGYHWKRVGHNVSIPQKSCHILVWFSTPDSFIFKNPMNRLSCSEWSGKYLAQERKPDGKQVWLFVYSPVPRSQEGRSSRLLYGSGMYIES